MIRDRRGLGVSALEVDNPAAWLERLDHDPEMHATIRRLINPTGGLLRTAEAVLLLEAHIAYTAPVRSLQPGWGDEWARAVTDLSDCRSVAQIRSVCKLLRANKQRGTNDA